MAARFTATAWHGRVHRIVVAITIAAVLAVGTAANLSAQWPTTCIELNDIVEQHLGNHHNVGIYQRTFGSGYAAEQACQNDHRNDVRATFGWAIPAPTVVYVPQAPSPPPGPSPDEQARSRFLSTLDDIVRRNRSLTDRLQATMEQSFGPASPQPFYDIARERRVLLIEIGRLHPPAGFARAHQLYSEAIGAALGAELSLASALESGDAGLFDAALGAFTAYFRLIGEADAELAAARAA